VYVHDPNAWVDVLGLSGAKGCEKGPSGKIGILKFLAKRWDKATFETVFKSIKYHVAKHGKGLSAVKYTQLAEKAFKKAVSCS